MELYALAVQTYSTYLVSILGEHSVRHGVAAARELTLSPSHNCWMSAAGRRPGMPNNLIRSFLHRRTEKETDFVSPSCGQQHVYASSWRHL